MMARKPGRGKAQLETQSPPLARPSHRRPTGLHYRHELGSIVNRPRLTSTEVTLIASHHRDGRPDFSVNAHDPHGPRADYIAAARRSAIAFITMQRTWGWWGQAWADALLRVADHYGAQPATPPFEEDSP